MVDIHNVSPENFAEVLKFARPQNSSLYAELMRGSNYKPSAEDLDDCVNDFVRGRFVNLREPFEPNILRERLEAVVDRYATARPDNAANVFTKVSSGFPATEEGLRNLAAALVKHDDARESEHRRLGHVVAVGKRGETPEQRLR